MFKVFNRLFKKSHSPSELQKKTASLAQNTEDDSALYGLNRFQLQNLVNKNIHFGFFQLEDFSGHLDPGAERLKQKAKRKSERALLMELKDQDLKQPLVLICDKGLVSKEMARKLRERGFVNVYFVDGGIQALSKAEE